MDCGKDVFLERTTKDTNADAIAFSVCDGDKITEITYSQFAEDISRAAAYLEKTIFSECMLRW